MRTFPEAEWEVPEGVSLIVGPNGTGKSTLMGIAAAWAIWGQVPGRSQDYLVRHGEREMVAEIQLHQNNQDFLIRRRFLLSPGGKGGTTALSLHEVDGSDLTQPIVKETQRKINEIAGPFEVWQMTAYVGQREGAGQFLQAKGHERKEIMRELISAGGAWDTWNIDAKNERDGTQRELDRAVGSIEDLEQIVSDIPNRQGQVAATAQQVENTTAEVKTSADELVAAVGKVAFVKEQQVAWDALLDKAVERENEVATAAELVSTTGGELMESEELSRKLPDLETQLQTQQGQVATREKEIADVQAENVVIAERNAESLKLDADDLEVWGEAELARVEAKKVATEAQDAAIAVQELHIKQCLEVASILDQIKDQVCIECRQPLTGDHQQELTDRQARILSEMIGEPDIEGAKATILELQSYEHPPAAERPVARPVQVFTDVPKSLQVNPVLLTQTLAARSADVEVARLTPIHEDAIAKWEASKERLEEAKAKLILALDRPDATLLEADVVECRRVAENAQAVYEEAVNAKTRAETLLDVAMEKKVELQERQTTIGNLRVELADWEQVVTATGINGVRQLIIDQSVGSLEAASNRWLQTIAPGFEIAFSTQSDTDRETFEEGVIMPSGVIQPWSELSGAQSVAVALAVRLGMAEVGGAAYGVHYETLYLDEADAWLSGDYQLQFMDYLSRVAETGIDVVAITHIEAVQDMIDQKTTIRAIDSETSEIR